MKRIFFRFLLLSLSLGLAVPTFGQQAFFHSQNKASYDVDAQAFITAAGITDATQKSAIDKFVKDLKAAGVWAKIKAIYPFVGGTATSHKFNLKDPRDLDAAFRLTFPNGMTHSANGIQGNGTNQYANTFFNPATHLVKDSNSYLFSLKTKNTNVNAWDFGRAVGTTSGFLRFIYNNTYKFSSCGESGSATLPTVVSTGLYAGASRTASSAYSVILNGSLASYSSTSAAILYSDNLTLLTQEQSFYSNAVMTAWMVGSGLTDTELTAANSANVAMQTTLGRL